MILPFWYILGIFIGLQIRQIIRDSHFTKKINLVKKPAWNSVVSLCNNFLENYRSGDYVEVDNELLKAYGEMVAICTQNVFSEELKKYFCKHFWINKHFSIYKHISLT